MPAEYKSNLPTLQKAIDAKLEANLKAAGAFVEGVVKEKLKVRNEPRRRTKPRKVGGVSRMVGLSPSEEGQPPKVMEGTLRSNVAYGVGTSDSEVAAFVGIQKDSQANKYARRLELGFHGADKRGRNINQGPRPFLRPSVTENTAAILKIICTGKAPKGSQRATKPRSELEGVTSE